MDVLSKCNPVPLKLSGNGNHPKLGYIEESLPPNNEHPLETSV